MRRLFIALVCALALAACSDVHTTNVSTLKPSPLAASRPALSAWSPGLTDPLVWRLTVDRQDRERWWTAIASRPATSPPEAPRTPSKRSRASSPTVPAPKQERPRGAPRSGVDWDAIAACESGGDWSANTGNGFEGGLQFTPSTWHAYGGSGHAYNASRAEQIAVAERVLAGQGIGAWPTCGRRG